VETMGELQRSNNCVRVERAAVAWSQGMQLVLRTADWGAGERSNDLAGDWRQHLGELGKAWITQVVVSATKAFRLASVIARPCHDHVVQSVMAMTVSNPGLSLSPLPRLRLRLQ
jgi:hypothetical protein